MVNVNYFYKRILAIEMIVAFAPVLFLFMFGVTMVPDMIGAMIENGVVSLESALQLGWFLCGTGGVIGIYMLADFIFVEKPKSVRSLLTAYFLCFLGVVAVSAFGYLGIAGPTLWSALICVIPIAVTLHFSAIAYYSMCDET